MLKQYRTVRPLIPVSVVLIGLWGAFTAAAPQTFLDKYIYISFMTSIPFIAIAAAGITLAVIAGEMDMSFASNMAMSGFIFALVTRASGSPALGMAAALTMGAFIGLVNGLTIVGTGAPSIVVTIGFDFFWRGTVMLLSNGLAVSLASIRNTPTVICFTGRIGGLVPAQTCWMLFISLLFAVILHRTAFGDSIRFTGDNREAARMMGLPVRRTRIGVFVLAGTTAAFSGVLSCMELGNWWPTQGEGYLLLVFASVFLGGTSVSGGRGTLWGSLAGAIVIGMIEAGLVSAGFSGFWTRFVHGLVLVSSVVFYSLASGGKRIVRKPCSRKSVHFKYGR